MIYNFGYWGYLSALSLLALIPISFYMMGKTTPARAAMLVMLHASMWLPQGAAFDFPLVPPMDKSTIAVLVIFVFALMRLGKRVRAAKFGRGIDFLLIGMFVSTAGTVVTNTDPQYRGIVTLQAMSPYDGVSFALRDFVYTGIPFLVGRVFIRSSKDLQDVLKVWVVCGLIYTIPIFYELRMSPMLHVKVYGFSGHADWLQNVRAGGYRATVFMGHGLGVGFFMSLATLCALTLYKADVLKKIRGIKMFWVLCFLFVVLVLQKASAAMIYAAVGFLMIMLLSVKAQMRIVLVLSLIVILFPVLRITDVFPTKELVELSTEQLGKERAESLQFRFDNEDVLVHNTEKRQMFGWGGFGRERLYDPWTGKDLTVSDGMWIIVYSTRGFAGFFCYFLLHLAPVFYLAFRINRVQSRTDRILLAGTGLIVTICSVNMLPNADMKNLPLFLSGGLWVLTKELSQKQKAKRSAPTARGPHESPSAPAKAPGDVAAQSPV